MPEYKGNYIQYINRDDGSLSLRLCNKYGFRWFESKDQNNRTLKIKEAARIEQVIQDNPMRSEYAFKSPIWI